MKEESELANQQEHIVKEIYKQAEKMGLSNDDIEPITDGVCSIRNYLKSSPKVMWILKEPVDSFDENNKPVGGGWSIAVEFENIEKISKQRSWQQIIYVMYGYLNGLMYDDMDYIHNNREMAKVMQSLAYLNVSKMPGYKRSYNNYIKHCYSIWKPILEKQIKIYSPDVIIYAGTFSYFKKDFEVVDLKLVDSVQDAIDVYQLGKKILIDAYHPLQTQIKRCLYVNSIIEMLNMFFPRK